MSEFAHNFVDLTGLKFGKMLVIERVGKDKNRRVLWKCLCDCGNYKIACGKDLRAGKIKTCGCSRKEIGAKKRGKPRPEFNVHTTHGLSKEPLYKVWIGMKGRCNNKNHSAYKNYGGRGIKICDRWQAFENFYNDMKDTYQKGLTLERKDNDKDYSPDNCIWITRQEQNRNKRSNRIYTINGITDNVTELCKIFNIPYGTVIDRLNRGVDPVKAFTIR